MMKAKLYLSLSLLYALLISTTWIFSGNSSNIISPEVAFLSSAKGRPLTTQTQNWTIVTVDSTADVGRYNALAVDSLGRPHISYYDKDSKDLKYARWTGSSWQIQVVDSTGDVGASNSIALDATNHPHISYVDNTNYALKYAWWNGSNWQIQTVVIVGGLGNFPTSIAVDQDGNAHIAYGDYNYLRLKYARWTGSIWEIQTVENAQSYDVSLALDNNNRPHIAYDKGTLLRYALREGATWQIETVTYLANPGEATTGDLSLVLDDTGNPHIAYVFKVDSGTSRLRYTHKVGNNWEDQAVDFESGVHTGLGASIALDENRRPHISYRNHLRVLKYAYFTGSNWTIQTIQNNVCFAGCDNPLALDANGNPHISFYEYNVFPYVPPKLKYATISQEPPTPTPTSTPTATPTSTPTVTPSPTPTPGPMDKFIYLPLVLK